MVYLTTETIEAGFWQFAQDKFDEILYIYLYHFYFFLISGANVG